MWRHEDTVVTCLLALLAMRIWIGEGLIFFLSLPRRVLKATAGL